MTPALSPTLNATSSTKHVKRSSVILCFECDKVIETHGRMIFDFYMDCQRYYHNYIHVHVLGMGIELCHCSHTGSLSGEDEYRLSYKFLLKMVLSRCSDKAPRYGYLGVSTAISLVRTRCLKWASGLCQLSHCLRAREFQSRKDGICDALTMGPLWNSKKSKGTVGPVLTTYVV